MMDDDKDKRIHGAGEFRHRALEVGGDEGHLAAGVQQAPDLPDRDIRCEGDHFFGQPDGAGAGGGGSVDRHLNLLEVRLRPVLPLEVLVPGEHGNGATGAGPLRTTCKRSGSCLFALTQGATLAMSDLFSR